MIRHEWFQCGLPGQDGTISAAMSEKSDEKRGAESTYAAMSQQSAAKQAAVARAALLGLGGCATDEADSAIASPASTASASETGTSQGATNMSGAASTTATPSPSAAASSVEQGRGGATSVDTTDLDEHGGAATDETRGEPTTPGTSPSSSSADSGSGGTGGVNGAPSGSPNAGAGGTTDGGAANGGNSSGGTATAGTSDDVRAAEVCERWAVDRADLSEGTWSGSVDTCEAGDVSEPARANALRLVNLYRFLSAMPEVEMDATLNAAAQECALLQSANELSHTPPTTAACYTEEAANVAGKSSISSGKLVDSIDGYMTDGKYGDPENLGHRRWVLANSLGPVGFGSAIASCFYQGEGVGHANKEFAAWPPPGPVPLSALTTTEVDSAGWSIQSDTVDLNAATVSVSEDGQDLPIEQYSLGAYYGSAYAVRLVPKDWESRAGHSYTVSVNGTAVSYTVEVVACAAR
jgi:Cysteine-rich secretory protein family